MIKSVLLAVIVSMLFLTSCETTREISIQADGNGSYVTTSDMSALLGMAKMSGGAGADLDKLGDAIDTTISLSDKIDSIPDLTPAEKELLKKGTVGIKMDVKNDAMITKLSFPFSNTGQIKELDKVSSRVTSEILQKQMAGEKAAPPGMDKMMPQKSVDDYFITNYSKGLIERKLDAEKYAGVEKDEQMQALKQLSSMGLGNTKLIFNLPSPVKKAEGKNLTVSEDKKTVTIMSSIEDFFENAKNMEFRLEY